MIPSLELDTLTWAALMDAARARLAEVAGRWTLHAPVDPGITLLEALATQLEERLYRLDRTDPEMVRRALALLGGDPIAPARAALAVLGVDEVPPGPDGRPAPRTLPAGTVFRAEAALPPVLVSTRHPVTVIPGIQLARLEVNGVDLRARLDHQERVALFPRPGPARVQLMVRVPAHAGRSPVPLSLHLALGPGDPRTERRLGWLEPGPDGPSPHRVAALGEVAPLDAPFDVTWTVQGDPVAVSDGTFGLRHSGLVQIPLPARHPGGEVVIGIAVDRPAAIDPPLLRSVGLNAVVVHHRRPLVVGTADIEAGIGAGRYGPGARAWLDPDHWAGLPGIELSLRPLVDGGRPGDAANRVFDDGRSSIELRERDGIVRHWSEVRSLGSCGPGDRSFVVDRAGDAIRFGDGLHGRIPRPAFPLEARLAFDLGGGPIGPLTGAGTGPWTSGPVVAHGLTELAGGGETETADDAASRASGSGRRRSVAVTPADYAEVIHEADPELGSARVHVVGGCDPGAPVPVADTVAVLVIPAADRPDETAELATVAYGVPAPRLDPGLGRRVDAALAASRLLGTQVRSAVPCYRPVVVTLEAGGPLDAALINQVRARLRRFLDPVVGGPHGNGWPLGQAVVPGQLLDRAQRAVGRAASFTRLTVTVEAARPGGPSATSDCDPVVLGRLDLPYLAGVRS